MRVIVTGATGMVGEGVLHECLQHPDVDQVLVINRKPCGVSHLKLKEVIHLNFQDLGPIESQLVNYDACFFCLGVSSVGMKEQQYHHLTYDLTIHVAETMSRLTQGMTFCYVSGSGTDSSEKGKRMWARVKGKTENKLLQLPFKKAYMFRPGFMKPTEGMKNTLRGYGLFTWMYPALRSLFPNFVCTLKEVGIAMINTVRKGYPKPILEVADIVVLGRMGG